MDGFHSPVRTVHHLSCSGGTLVSKCIAVCGNSIFLSEINPMAPYGSIRFAPLDLISQVQAQYKNLSRQDRIDFFQDQMRLLSRISDQEERVICIRDHTHSSFLRRGNCRESELLETLRALKYDTLSVATVRHPIDAFAGMLQRNWAGGVQNSFHIYCVRVMAFLDYCEGNKVKLWRYEDFCRDPSAVLRQICGALSLDFNENFLGDFQNVKLSGDSGRSSPDIHLRERRSIDKNLAAEAAESDVYHVLCDRLGYASDVSEYPLKGDYQFRG